VGKLYRPGGPAQGEECAVRLTRFAVEMTAPDGEIITMRFEGLAGKLAGYEDAYVVLSAPTEGGSLDLWVRREFMGELAEYEPSFSPDFRLTFARLRSKQRTGSVLRFLSPVVALLAVIGLAWFVFGGGLASIVVAGIPVSVEEAIGAAGLDELTASETPCASPEVVGAVQDVLSELVAQRKGSGYTFEVTVLQSPDVNAFAVPGGKLFVYSGLLELTEDPSELAAVLGHEMEHILGRHTLRRLVHRVGIGVALGALIGDSSELVVTLGALAGDLGALEFGRDHERAADVVGLELLTGAGFDPAAAPRFFGKLAESQGETGSALESAAAFLSTHPSGAERVQRLTGLTDALQTPAAPRMHELDWASIRGGCSAQ